MATDGHTPDTTRLLKEVTLALVCAATLTEKLKEAATLEPAHAAWWEEKAEEAASLTAAVEAARDRIERWGKRRWTKRLDTTR